MNSQRSQRCEILKRLEKRSSEFPVYDRVFPGPCNLPLEPLDPALASNLPSDIKFEICRQSVIVSDLLRPIEIWGDGDELGWWYCEEQHEVDSELSKSILAFALTSKAFWSTGSHAFWTCNFFKLVSTKSIDFAIEKMPQHRMAQLRHIEIVDDSHYHYFSALEMPLYQTPRFFQLASTLKSLTVQFDCDLSTNRFRESLDVFKQIVRFQPDARPISVHTRIKEATDEFLVNGALLNTQLMYIELCCTRCEDLFVVEPFFGCHKGCCEWYWSLTKLPVRKRCGRECVTHMMKGGGQGPGCGHFELDEEYSPEALEKYFGPDRDKYVDEKNRKWYDTWAEEWIEFDQSEIDEAKEFEKHYQVQLDYLEWD